MEFIFSKNWFHLVSPPIWGLFRNNLFSLMLKKFIVECMIKKKKSKIEKKKVKEKVMWNLGDPQTVLVLKKSNESGLTN